MSALVRLSGGLAGASLALGLALAGCTSSGSSVPEGLVIYRREACATCHGTNGAGSALGPPLTGLEQNWTVDSLAEFLADPDAFVDRDPRLAELAASVSSPMTPFAHLSESRRRTLAEWLLTR